MFSLFLFIWIPLTVTLELALYYPNSRNTVVKRSDLWLDLYPELLTVLTGRIHIGTPWQEFTVFMDTTSDLFLLFESSDYPTGLAPAKTFDLRSTTLASRNSTFSKPYHLGCAEGQLYTDILYFHEQFVGEVYLALASSRLSSVWFPPGLHGYFGLRPEPETPEISGSLLDIITAAQRNSRPCFTLSINNTQSHEALQPAGRLIFGSFPQTNQLALVKRLSLVKNDKWIVHFLGLWIGHRRVALSLDTAEFNSMSPYIWLSPKLVAHVHNVLGLTNKDQGIYYVDCAKVHLLPPISFRFIGTEIQLGASEYIHRFMHEGQPVCASPFTSHFGKEFSSIMLGTTFMKKMRTVFDKQTSSIYFYPVE